MPQILAFGQFIILLLQIFPHAVRAWKEWEEFRGERLDREERNKLAKEIGARVPVAAKTLAEP